jgi:hypothetical protein
MVFKAKMAREAQTSRDSLTGMKIKRSPPFPNPVWKAGTTTRRRYVVEKKFYVHLIQRFTSFKLINSKFWSVGRKFCPILAKNKKVNFKCELKEKLNVLCHWKGLICYLRC